MAHFAIDGKTVWAGKRTDGREYISRAEAVRETKLFLAGCESELPYARFRTGEPLMVAND